MINFSPTNTMALSSFDVLKMDDVEDPLINVNKLATIDLEESYFSEAVEFINNSNRKFTTHKINLYKNLSEATTEFVILESFSDFFVKIKDIIDKFIKFIKSLFDRFINNIMGMVSSDKYLIKHKDKIKGFKTADEFDFYGYTFTLTPGIPVASAIQRFTGDLFDDLKTDAVNKQLTTNSVKDSVAGIDYADKYDMFRGKVLGKDNYPIYASDFSEELFKEFRNGSIDTDNIEVTSAVVLNSIRRFEDYKKIKSSMERDKKDIEKSYEAVKKEIQNITKRNGDLNTSAFLNNLPDDINSNIKSIETNQGLTMSGDLMVQLDLYVKAKADMIQEYSNIHALAFSAKLDALKSCYTQDRTMLYAALNRVSRTDSKRKDV